MRTSGDIVEMGWGCQQLQGQRLPKKHAPLLQLIRIELSSWNSGIFASPPVSVPTFILFFFISLFNTFLLSSEFHTTFVRSKSTRNAQIASFGKYKKDTSDQSQERERKKKAHQLSNVDGGRRQKSTKQQLQLRALDPASWSERAIPVRPKLKQQRARRKKKKLDYLHTVSERTNERAFGEHRNRVKPRANCAKLERHIKIEVYITLLQLETSIALTFLQFQSV